VSGLRIPDSRVGYGHPMVIGLARHWVRMGNASLKSQMLR